MDRASKIQFDSNGSDDVSLAKLKIAKNYEEQERKLMENRFKLKTVQLEACANLLSIRECYRNNVLALELNTLIYDLKYKNIYVMEISNRSISYLKLNLKRDTNMRQRAQNCFAELRENLENFEQKLKEILEKGQKVKGFQGIKEQGNLQRLVDEYLEQIKSTKIKWTVKNIETYSEEIRKYNQSIAQIEYAPSNVDELIRKLSSRT
ncbi:unnamed protein product [Caenorhabditis brenneri]